MTLGGITAGISNVDYPYPDSRSQTLAKEVYSDVSQAAEQVFNDNDGKVIGLAMLPFGNAGMHYDIRAQYAPESTESDPIVQVTSNYGGEVVSYKIHINDVNPRNASQLEMFALLSYADDQGLADSGSLGSYQKLMVYAENAKMNGHWEGNASYNAFVNQTHDWQKIIIHMWDDYSDAGLYSQQLNCMNLNGTMERFSIRFVDFENITFVDASANTYLHSKFSDIPEEVSKAWYEAAVETETDVFGKNSNERFLHLSQLMRQRLLKWQSDDESKGVSGSPVQAALNAAKEALRALEYPLTPDVMQSPEVQEEIKKEKEFYEAFIRKLEALQRPAEANRESEKETKTDYMQIIQDYIKKLFTKIENGDTELVYQTGGQAFTEKEWDKLLKSFDSAEDEIKKLIEEEQLRMIAVDKDGIRCGRPGQDEYEWELVFTDKSQYERALELIRGDFRLSELLTI